MEKQGYRDNLERLDKYFPAKEMLTRTDIVSFTGLSRKSINSAYAFAGKYISKADFARMISH